MDKQAPDWFYQAISNGLRALVVLHLPGAPGHETVAFTEDVWVQVLWTANIDWQEHQDANRLNRAFILLARQADRWPAPRALLELLPARPEPAALPAPRVSRAQAEQARKTLAKIMAGLTKDKRL